MTLRRRSAGPPALRRSRSSSFISLVAATICLAGLLSAAGADGSTGRAGASAKLGPYLSLLAGGTWKTLSTGSAGAPRPTALAHLLGIDLGQSVPTVRVLLSHQGDLAPLLGLGVVLTGRLGGIHAARVPVARLLEFARAPGVGEVRASRRLRPLLDVSGARIRAAEARVVHGLDGRGVIIGIVDTGIDYRHVAFRRPDGSTRIIAIRDYSVLVEAGDGTGRKLPRVFSRWEIDAALRAGKPLGHSDDNGHGTHVAGIAAGNGRSSTDRSGGFVGVAPQADLLVVKATRKDSASFDSADVLDAIAYIDGVATTLKRPYVVNLSLGGHSGGHDGATMLERGIDSVIGQNRRGKMVVVAAGNEGGAAVHAAGRVSPGRPVRLPLLIPQYVERGPSTATAVALEVWYESTGNLSVRVIPPEGDPVGGYKPGEQTTVPSVIAAGRVLVDHGVRATAPRAMRAVVILSGNADRHLMPGEWTIELSGTARRFDAWIAESTLPDVAVRFIDYVSTDMLVGVPGCARWALTVGSFNSRAGWVSSLRVEMGSSLELGVVSPFSSPGPTRDGRPKPEITGPGLYVVAPRSLSVNEVPALMVHDPGYSASQGTSQAAPHAAGAVALLFQMKPELDAREIRSLLISSALPGDPKGGGTLYHGRWGFGRLDVVTAAAALRGGSPGPPSASRSTIGVGLERLPADGRSQTEVWIIPRDPSGVPLARPRELKVTTTAGRLVGEPRLVAPYLYQATLRAGDRPGVARIEASIDGMRLEAAASVVFGLPPFQHPAPEGCSCASAGRERDRSPRSLLAVILLAFALLVRLSKGCWATGWMSAARGPAADA